MVFLSNLSQLATVALAVALGFCCCLCYDCLRILRLGCSFSRLDIGVQDVLCGMVFAVCTFLLLLSRCLGEIRLYVLVSEAAGFWLCRVTVSRLLMGVSMVIIAAIRRSWRWLSIRIFHPVRVSLGRLFGWGASKSFSFLKKTRKTLKKLLKRVGHSVYNEPRMKLKRGSGRRGKKQKPKKSSRRKRVA